jgi:glycosyltransferase involved in cell wall biosynthesis
MQVWVDEGIIEYLRATDDVRPYIREAHCVVLPSYREGLPRTLLEAAAIGRPIIATDVTGCREVVEHGVNGYLCKARDADDLAQKMRDMVKLSIDERREMGQRGRKKIEENFDEKIVVQKIVNRIESILKAA